MSARGDASGRPRLVLDTNVLGRAIVGSRPSLELVLRWHAGDFLLCVSNDVLGEYRRVLPCIARADAGARDAILDQLRRGRHTHVVRPPTHLSISPHESDNRFIECAVEGSCIALITFNDRHFLPWMGGLGIAVSRPREYLPALVERV